MPKSWYGRYVLSEGTIPKDSWEALLKLGLNEYQAYRAWQIIEGAIMSKQPISEEQ
jgi:hypothetical protein